jgi:trehalose 6-phosphate synthase
LEEALIVNPYNIDEMAEALHQAIEMPLKERMERHEALMERIRRHDAAGWQKDFLSALGRTRTGLAA